jgi:phosphoribosylformylglycinamidine (FGAM) synthase-like enzyme
LRTTHGRIFDSNSILKDKSLAVWEIKVSESQERMLIIVPADKKDKAIEILSLYGIEFSVLGHITSDNILTVMNGGQQVAQFHLDYVAQILKLLNLVQSILPLRVEKFKYNFYFLFHQWIDLPCLN